MTEPGAKRRWYLWAGLAVVVVLVAIVIAAAVRPRPQSDYDDATRARFLDACTASGGDPVRDTCTCLYEKIEASVPFDRFELMDALMASQSQTSVPGQLLDLPDDVDAMLQECIAAEGAN